MKHLLIVLVLCVVGLPSWASSAKVLKALSAMDGINPYGAVVFDASGKLYATASDGGGLQGQDQGTVLVLTPTTSGAWSESAVFAFGQAKKGIVPLSNLLFDSQGNLYGTTVAGGAYGKGTIFMLTPSSHGYWTQTVLHSFNGTDGNAPYDLFRDGQGNFFGLTGSGGSNNEGVAYELSPTGSTFSYSILHSFGSGTDGYTPHGGLVQDSVGNLYGATANGGKYSFGAIFQLSPTNGGTWDETVIYDFGSARKDGTFPNAGLTMDADGDLFGTTSLGGAFGYGAVLEFSPSSGGWMETIIYSFGGKPADGKAPHAVILDSNGNLFGTTFNGGSANSGIAYELTPLVGGEWKETILHTFLGGIDGSFPFAQLVRDSSGNIFGSTISGGASNGGIVFEITP